MGPNDANLSGQEMVISASTVFTGALVFLWLEFLWEAYLSYRQRKVYRKYTEPPKELEGILDTETFNKARLYALDKSNFGAVQDLFNQVKLCFKLPTRPCTCGFSNLNL